MRIDTRRNRTILRIIVVQYLTPIVHLCCSTSNKQITVYSVFMASGQGYKTGAGPDRPKKLSIRKILNLIFEFKLMNSSFSKQENRLPPITGQVRYFFSKPVFKSLPQVHGTHKARVVHDRTNMGTELNCGGYLKALIESCCRGGVQLSVHLLRASRTDSSHAVPIGAMQIKGYAQPTTSSAIGRDRSNAEFH